MQETLQEFIASIQQPLTRVLGESIVNILYAILILIALLIAYKVSKRLIIGAMHIQQRTDNQVRQFMAMWRYGFLLACIVFIIVSMSGSLQQEKQGGKVYTDKGFVHLRGARSITERLGIEIFAQKQYNELILLQDRNLAGGGVRIRNCQWVEL